MSLHEWLKHGWLVAHQTGAQEIADLLAVADRDLHDCRTRGLSADWRLNIAYNAALQAATAALAASGYRAARESHHLRTIDSLTHTVGVAGDVVAQFDQFRKKRNIGEYERAGSVSNQEAHEMLLLAQRIREDVIRWLREIHPELLLRP